ncbi:polysaccharide pyruvyl transferase family protein [Corynebacterium sp. TAE3-ERU2]|uniref:polysaccharide pyruvyl transferase family protein n=1 Tax=Corynebacterium sp. TAE3-ERU2 TaxID=2849497 RepID=UPI001C440791|nr:polysaccharide pyruvyl transferase family protein [Corynebacterium sp. TAE3-ERU2]
MASTKDRIISVLPQPVFQLLRRGRATALNLRDHDRALAGYSASDQRVFSAHPAEHSQQRRGTVLIASTGVANIGDQAMLTAALQTVPGPVTVVAKPEATYTIEREDVTVLHAADAFYGHGRARAAAVETLAEHIAQAEHLCIIGADIIDGGYQRGVAYKTWSLARAAAAAGYDTRILGFSWGTAVDEQVSSIARAALAAGVQACCRDSISYQRFRADTQAAGDCEHVADVVFNLPTATAPAAAAPTQPYTLINVSGLISHRMDQVQDYLQVCRYLSSHGRELVFIPHVANRGGDDRQAIREVTTALDSEQIPYRVLPDLLSPAEVAQWAAGAESVVTGRMHLSILSFSNLTPAVVLGTQGKVEGLVSDLELPWLLVEPRPGMGGAICAALERIASDPEAVQDTLRTTVPQLRERAAENFRGL